MIVTLAGGRQILIRPIEPGDQEELARGLQQLSLESRYRRFFVPISRFDARDLAYLTDIDHHDHEALVAIDEQSAVAVGVGVGVARYVRIAPDVAEPALVVLDEWQRRGVGTALLSALVERARSEGIARFDAPVLATNSVAIRVLQRIGTTQTIHDGTEVRLLIDLPGTDHTEGPLPATAAQPQSAPEPDLRCNQSRHIEDVNVTTAELQIPSRPKADTLFIDGAWVGAAETFERFDPLRLTRSTGRFASASTQHVRDAYAAASEAQPEWAATPAAARADVLRRAAGHLEADAERAARRLTADMGKAIRDARGEVLRSVAILRYFAGELSQPVGETYASADPSTMLLTIEQPLGVVCAITPWNFPFAIPTWKLAPALAFGNSVVWKPAEAASGSAVLLTEALAAGGLPGGVLNLLTGHGRVLSGALTGDRRLAALTFTGGADVGSRLRQAVADRNVKVQLELGGKNPAIVLANADLQDAAVQVTRGAMLAAGQRCTATSRVYVEQSVAETFTALLHAEVEKLVIGDPFDEATDIGPLASTDQHATVSEYLHLAGSEHADAFASSSVPPERCFIAPTVLVGVRSDSRLVREEIFGPVLIVEVVDDFDAALAAANDTEFGLSSAIFTRDIAAAMRFIRLTESGIVHVNRETAGVEPHVPFGGIKGSSSMSREQGKAARQFFTTTKTVYLRSV